MWPPGFWHRTLKPHRALDDRGPEPAASTRGSRGPTATPDLRSRTFDRVVVPVGGRAAELAVQRAAVRLADRLGVPVRAVHVRQGPYGPPVDLFGHVGSLCDGRDVPLDAEVLEGDVVETLCADLTPSDLVIVGADAGNHAGDDAEAGDRSWAVVVEALVRRAPCRVQVLAQE